MPPSSVCYGKKTQSRAHTKRYSIAGGEMGHDPRGGCGISL
jgi:hypothetical protein|tara:strand:- start:516 stop:638 length:123 start_codon:yes stop_codon:yes gene_type:complete